MLNRKTAIGASLIAILVLSGSGFALGYETGKRNPKSITVEGVSNMTDPSSNVDFGVFWETWKVLEDMYLKDKDVAAQDKVYGAINGLVNSLNDPYSEFFSPKESKKFQDDIRGNFSGIGAEIGIRKEQLMIIAPLKNSPAMSAGLRAGDKIYKINSTSTENLTLDESVMMIRGPKGTKVTLTIFRDGWEEVKEIVITRDNIEVPTLDYEMKGNVAYIQLYGFNANANRAFYDAVSEALGAGAKGMILDLRNNPGGYLEVSVDLAGWFMPKGTLVVKEVGRTGVLEEFKSTGSGALKDFPVVVLINEGSASASEILAGALRDNREIKLIGETSFGKGTVQQLRSLTDGSSVKVTIAQWVLPKGQILENEGLKPDFEVELTEEDIENGRDPQYDKALDVLKSQMQ